MSDKTKNLIRSLTVIVIFIAVWALLTKFHIFSEYIFPGPTRVWKAFADMAVSGELLKNLGASILRVLAGFGISAVLALILGVVFTGLPSSEAWSRPILNFLQHVPPLSLMPLLILWFGIGEPSKIIIIVLTAFFPIFLNTLSGIRNCDVRLLEVGQVLNMSEKSIFLKIRIPSALPSIMVGMKLGLGYSWRAIVGAEMIAATRGLGYMILDAQAMARTDKVLVGIILIGILGVLMDLGFDRLTRGVIHSESLEVVRR